VARDVLIAVVRRVVFLRTLDARSHTPDESRPRRSARGRGNHGPVRDEHGNVTGFTQTIRPESVESGEVFGTDSPRDE
jgi:hypothetical protein